MADAGLSFKISADLDSKGFHDAAAAWRALGEEQEKFARGTQKGATAVDMLKAAYASLAALGVISFLKSCVDESMQAEQNTFLLQQAVEMTGRSWDKSKKQISDYTEALRANTRFSRDDATAALTAMIEKTRDLGTAESLLGDAMGIAVAKGMDLKTAADMVAGAQMGAGRGAAQLGTMMGMTKKSAQDTELVMRELHRRYGELAKSEDTAMKASEQFKNSLKEIKEKIGDWIVPGLQTMTEWLLRVGGIFKALVDTWVAGWTIQVNTAVGAYESIKLAMHGHFAAAKQEIINTVAGDKAMWEEVKKDWIDGYKELTGITEEGNKKIIAAEEKKYRVMADKEQELLKNRMAVAYQAATIMGTATAKGLQGDVKAWREASAQIIDIMAQQIQAHILMIAQEKAIAAFPDPFKMMAAEAIGFAKAFAIGGIASAAKGAIQGGGGAGGGAPAGTPQTAGLMPSAATEAQGPTPINVNVYGDYVSDTQFAQDLARRISDSVEGRDLRFVASQVR